jgi:ABC-type lipoprotein release transport system permease subunit
MLLPKMALRNLFRHPKRVIITSIAIAVGVAAFILFDSLLSGWFTETERGYIDYEVASGRIVRDSWWKERDELPLTEAITDTDAITTLLEDLDIPYAPRTEFRADLVFYEDPYPSSGVYPTRVVAVDPELDARVFDLAKSIDNPGSRGQFLTDDTDGIVVGAALADDLHMEVGYPVRLQFAGNAGYEEVVSSEVIGIVKTDSPIHNTTGVYMSLDAADYYLQTTGAVTGYSFELPSGRRGAALMNELRERLPDEYRILGYEEIAEAFVAMQEAESGGAGAVIFIVFLIAAVGVSNTMMMAVFERRREIGMLRAQGLPDRSIFVLFFLEGAGIGLVGALFGVAIGALVNIPLVNIGLDYGALLQMQGDVIDMGSIALPSSLKGMWRGQAFLVSGIVAILVSSLVTWFPTRRLLRQDIPTNLRQD